MNITPKFPVTNECTNAIVAGLDLKSYDKVFSICGSGDQAFKLLEIAETVLAVDYEESQIDYAEKRLKKLKSSRKGFYNDYYHWKSKDFEKIKAKSDKIVFAHSDMMDVDFSYFNKVYMSNACTYSCYDPSPFLNKVLSELQSDTLIYFSSCGIREYVGNINKKRTRHKFYLEEKLSKKASKLEKGCKCKGEWTPVVYRILPRGIELVK